MDFQAGEILYCNKPINWTSFDLVAMIRKKITRSLNGQKIKVGHAGTLDPLATGVMIVCTGKATKRMEEFLHLPKEYIATIQLGATTPSYDLETPINATYPTDHISRTLVEKALQSFIGTIEQLPPDYSACKMNGSKAYEYARKGLEVRLKPKQLIIENIELLTYEKPSITIRVECSKGTYIRALARDLGVALESGAHLTDLVRTRIGSIQLSQCLSIDEIAELFHNS